jgi:hypothetical protein
MSHVTDPYTQGARDCPAGRPDQSGRMSRSQRSAYRHGFRVAMRRVCQRLDVAYQMRGHFSQEALAHGHHSHDNGATWHHHKG